MFENTKSEIILHTNEVGSIVQCPNCEDLLVKVQNMLYACDINKFNYLHKIINYVNENINDHIVEVFNTKCVLICTPNVNINLTFSKKEFNLLVELFEQSNHMLNVNELIH